MKFEVAIAKSHKKHKNKFLAWLNSIRYYITSNVIWFLSDIQLYPWPLFCIFRTHGYRVNAEQTRRVFTFIRPGDILLRRFDKYLGTRFIPGYFTHSALYVGDLSLSEPDRIVHALGEGVIKEDLLKFLRCDDIVVIRPNLEEEEIKKVVAFALNHIGALYDFDFDFNNNVKFSCTEFVYACFKEFKEKLNIKPKKRLWKLTIIPDDYLEINGKKVYDTRIQNG